MWSCALAARNVTHDVFADSTLERGRPVLAAQNASRARPPSAQMETLQPALMKYLRTCLRPRYTFGYLLVTAACGATHGMSPIFESESSDCETAPALNDVHRAPGQHSTILFYDSACFRRRPLQAHPDLDWASTINNVDRSEPFFFLSATTKGGTSTVVSSAAWGFCKRCFVLRVNKCRPEKFQAWYYVRFLALW